MSDELTIRYVPIEEVVLWDKNPKKHDIGAIVESIRRYGFIDPPKRDMTLGALVYGNGRAEALSWMRAQGDDPPRGIKVEGDTWLMPVKEGVDALSVEEAEAAAIDHNNLTMSGGDYSPFDMARMWGEGYTDILAGLGTAGVLPITVDGDALDALLGNTDWQGALGGLPDGDRAPFQQMTFTVSDEQAGHIKRALSKARGVAPFIDTGNENSNGNALARVCEVYLGIS